MSAKALIQVKDLRKQFGKQEVLKGITTDIKAGEVVCVIGPSGSGKSTFLRCLNRLEEASSGSIFFEGEDLCDKKTDIDRVRQRMGMVFQQFNLFPHMNILKNLTIGPIELQKRSREEAEAYAIELLHKVGLAERANAYPQQLSGGQQQRIAIVRALCMKPDVMLFDEPTSALDPEMVGEVLNVMNDRGRCDPRDGLCARSCFSRHVPCGRLLPRRRKPRGTLRKPEKREIAELFEQGVIERGGIRAVKKRKQTFSAYASSFCFCLTRGWEGSMILLGMILILHLASVRRYRDERI